MAPVAWSSRSVGVAGVDPGGEESGLIVAEGVTRPRMSSQRATWNRSALGARAWAVVDGDEAHYTGDHEHLADNCTHDHTYH